MAEGGGGEKQFLGKLLQKQTKYGTNSRLTQKNSTFIKHSVIKGDTLMGIALKYGVTEYIDDRSDVLEFLVTQQMRKNTVEQIKRENKLWTNDSLFLREYLLIPVQNEDVSSIPEHYQTVVIDNASRSRSSSQKSNTSAKSDDHSEKTVQSMPNSTNGESGLDFLSKYDSSIAQLKSNIDQMEKNASCLPGNLNDNSYTYPRRKSSQRTTHNSNLRKGSLDSNGQLASFYDNEGYSGSDKDLTNSPVLMIKSKSSTRKVKTSLDRIEQQNDEIFEL